MNAAEMNPQPREAPKKKGVMKKVLKYLQDQAAENSNTRTYLTPPGLEPQQRTRHTPPRSRQDKRSEIVWAQRRFSDATTAVESRQQLRAFGASRGSGIDMSAVHETDSPRLKEAKRVQYAQDNILQNYKLYLPDRTPETVRGNQFWILYIHGGYFRDPKVDASSFGPALEILTARQTASASGSLATVPESTTSSQAASRSASLSDHDPITEHVACFASINYRLSPHADYPQDPNTENYMKRDARFPDQLDDVHAAIRHLQTRHDFTTNYILAGHSVGATLAFLAALHARAGQIDPPLCVVGLNGIYDFPHIHHTNPDYEAMTANAMRADQYAHASPALYARSDYENVHPKETLRVLLSHSKDDGLVDWSQLERMRATLEPEPEPDQQPRLHLEVIETRGQHDAIWGEGRELARSLADALGLVMAY